nr:hypothetical protein [Sorangium cellulosum]
MSMNGWSVTSVGTQVKGPWTSRSGLSAEISITYSGATVKAASPASTPRRSHATHAASRMARPLPVTSR